MEISQSLLPIIIIFIAFFGESIFGLGAGLISIPLLSISIGPKAAVTFVLIFQLFIGFLTFPTRRHTHWVVAVPMTISIIIGTIIGTYMLSLIDDNFLRKFLAITILIFLSKMLFLPKITLGNKPTKLAGFITGLVGGWFQGITGTSSPVFTMYLLTAKLDKSAMRATLIYILSVSSVVRVIISISQGLFTPQIIKLALPTIPFFLLAIYLGHHVHKKLDEKYYQYAIYVILFFSAIVLLLKK